MGWFKVFFGARDNGRNSRTEVMTTQQVERAITSRTNPDTGEVRGINKIEEIGNPDNSVEAKPKGWLW